jgi:hypothetical protein
MTLPRSIGNGSYSETLRWLVADPRSTATSSQRVALGPPIRSANVRPFPKKLLGEQVR